MNDLFVSNVYVKIKFVSLISQVPKPQWKEVLAKGTKQQLQE